MPVNLDALRAATARNTTVDSSAVALISGITQKIKDAIEADDLQDATAINELVAELEGSTDSLATAVEENTTPSEPPA